MFERFRNLLRAPEQKASRTAQLIAFEAGGRARWTPRDYAALTRDGYLRNAIVYRAVKLVAENVGGCTFVVEEGGATRDAHPLLDLLARPNPREAVAVDTHNAAAKWNKALLDNAARPSGALVLSGTDGVLSDEQSAHLKRELDESYQGARNAGRPLVLEGGLDWKSMSLSPKDMDFMEAKHTAAREIALAFGVPPQLLGIPGDNTYSNYQEANRVFFRATVLPFANRIAGALSIWLSAAFGQVRVTVDADQLDALSTDRAALWSRITDAPFLTLNEKRAVVGYAPVEGGH